MKIYTQFSDGALKSDTAAYIPPGHYLHREALKEVADGIAQLVNFVEPPKPSKVVRDEALQAMLHIFDDGRVIQVRPQDEQNIRNGIELLQKMGDPAATLAWVMADNVKHPVTAADLEEALQSGQLQAFAIWNDYNPEV